MAVFLTLLDWCFALFKSMELHDGFKTKKIDAGMGSIWHQQSAL